MSREPDGASEPAGPDDGGGDLPGSVRVAISRIRRDGSESDTDDDVVVEEPLEIRVEGRSIAVVMRTPGHDEELAAGFLLTEGVIAARADLFEITQCPSTTREARGNAIDVLLTNPSSLDLERLTRHVFTSSSCGICGKAAIADVFAGFPPLAAPGPPPPPERLFALPDRLSAAQATFRRTGGLHACALFDRGTGELLALREDVGRHNALDKLIGHALMGGLLPLANAILLLSGRVSFEMMQKALAAGIPVVAAISAPSSLAIRFARESGQHLFGFLREASVNRYTAATNPPR